MGAPYASACVSRILFRPTVEDCEPTTTIYLGPTLLNGLVRPTWD